MHNVTNDSDTESLSDDEVFNYHDGIDVTLGVDKVKE